MAAGFFVARQRAGEADGTSGKRRWGRDRMAKAKPDGRSGSGWWGQKQTRKREQTAEAETDGKNSNNYGFYSNAEVDELLNGAAKTTDLEWREKAYQRAAEILYLEDPVGCYLNSRNETVILSAQVEDFNMTPVGIYDWPSIKVRAN